MSTSFWNKKKILFILFIVLVILVVIWVTRPSGKNNFGSLSPGIKSKPLYNELTPFKVVSLLYLLASGKAVLGDWIIYNKKYDIYQMTFEPTDPYLPVGDVFINVDNDLAYNLENVFCLLVKNDNVNSIPLPENQWKYKGKIFDCDNENFSGPTKSYGKFLTVQSYDTGNSIDYVTYEGTQYQPMGLVISHNNNHAETTAKTGTVSIGVKNGTPRPFAAVKKQYLKQENGSADANIDLEVQKNGACGIDYLKFAYNSAFCTFTIFYQGSGGINKFDGSNKIWGIAPQPLITACCSNNTETGGILDVLNENHRNICPSNFKSDDVTKGPACENVMPNYCNTDDNITTSDCYYYAKRTDVNSDNLNLNTFCSRNINQDAVNRLNKDSSLDDLFNAYPMMNDYGDLCACYMPPEYYNHKLRLISGDDTIADAAIAGGAAIACHDDKCNDTNSVSTYTMKTQTCPTANIQICENKFILNNKGKIKGNITYKPEIECNQNVQPQQPQTTDEQQKYDLNVSTSGSGTVTVKDSGGNDISSNTANFTISVNSGWDVYLTATPDDGNDFAGWNGDASGTGSQVSIKMDNTKSVTATFQQRASQQPSQYTLTVNIGGTGFGKVTSSPGTINSTKNSSDSVSFDKDTEVVLTAIPDDSSDFTGWSDASFGNNSQITVKIDQTKSLTATFVVKQSEQPDQSPKNSNPFANLPTIAKVAAIVASTGILIAIIMYILRTLRLAKTVAAVV